MRAHRVHRKLQIHYEASEHAHLHRNVVVVVVAVKPASRVHESATTMRRLCRPWYTCIVVVVVVAAEPLRLGVTIR